MKKIFFIIPLLIILFTFATFLTATTSTNKSTATHNSATLEKALFAGGCFWCMEKPFEKLKGVVSVISGYSGGTTTEPTYGNYGKGGHIEVVQITYDSSLITYEELLSTYWRQINPTDAGGQFVDRGHEYSSAIYYYNSNQQQLAQESRENLAAAKIFAEDIVTPILPAQKFWPAEDYHQDYYKKNPIRYSFYRGGSGRDTFLKKHWKGAPQNVVSKTKETDLRSRLTPIQYKVTQEDGTEPPFNNLYWDNKEPGIYVDIVSGEPLFSSLDKYDSKTGWPSFSRPLVSDNIVEKSDITWLMIRTEVRSKKGDSHLGHIFDDGPPPTGQRYCINSASLRFIPADKLEDEGFQQFAKLF